MADYTYIDDGKIHTRFSELTRCTEKGVVSVVQEKLNLKKRHFGGGILEFGTERHNMFMEEAKKTGEVPQVFQEELGYKGKLDYLEQEFVTEIIPGVVMHSTTDAFNLTTRQIVDYKTVSDFGSIQKYKNSKQHLCYALQLLMLGVVPKGAVYLGEIWNKDRDNINSNLEIKGYEKCEIEFSTKDIIEFKNTWLKDRAERLKVAYEIIKQDMENLKYSD